MATIPLKSAMIVWNDVGESAKGRGKADLRVRELRVLDYDDKSTGRMSDRFGNSSGACDADWLKGHWRWTPMGIFLEIVTCDGFESQVALIAALHEFRKIEGQVWAVDLLHELGQIVEEEEV